MWPVEQAPTLITTDNNEDPIVVIGTSGDAAMTMQTDREIAQGLDQENLILIEASQ